MRKAFLVTCAGWVSVLITFLSNADQLRLVAVILALGLTALWIAHLAAHASRRIVPRRIVTEAAANLPTRRAAIVAFSHAFAVVLMATALPGRIRAQSVCGCRVGDICCNTQTQVTWECIDIQGCTQWILKGTACSEGQAKCNS